MGFNLKHYIVTLLIFNPLHTISQLTDVITLLYTSISADINCGSIFIIALSLFGFTGVFHQYFTFLCLFLIGVAGMRSNLFG